MTSVISKSVLLVAMLVQFGCASSDVKPWEKGVLSESVMSPTGLSGQSSLNEHVYTSKEAGRGGGGVGGGGCGCN